MSFTFYMLPKLLNQGKLKQALTNNDRMVYEVILNHVNISKSTGRIDDKFNRPYARFKLPTLAYKANVGRSTASKAVNKLYRLGLIDIRKMFRGLCYRYFINMSIFNLPDSPKNKPLKRENYSKSKLLSNYKRPVYKRHKYHTSPRPRAERQVEPSDKSIRQNNLKDLDEIAEHTTAKTKLTGIIKSIKRHAQEDPTRFYHIFNVLLRAKKHITNACVSKFKAGSVKLKQAMTGLRFEKNWGYYQDAGTVSFVDNMLRLAVSAYDRDKYMMWGFKKLFKDGIKTYKLNAGFKNKSVKGPDIPVFKI